ncbi:hypothetical protein H310_12045 [Aphanomyces invadans]|uniref:Uncharacterized protein n=1 Tax=Aphanomyces invadans TaxID=157072 RepID=A0A024TM87_9STRA|nr:hypothetical protein H310_12045 [Aphanomyces invadans]ETV94417.1 hypothetical protein H310_12045 [Aphanomyces invadans]|eukprot:XP_008877179.1 hypothetical protein H310_12045 [Aphanomyces invadans]
MPHATASSELQVQWGSSGLVIRHAFVAEVTMRPGKGSSKSKISFWDAKKMLETLRVQFDHARTVTKSNQDTMLVVRLYFFKAEAFNGAFSTVSGQPNSTVFAQGNAVEIHISEVDTVSPSCPLAVTAPADFDQHLRGCRADTVHIKGLPAKWFDVNTSRFLDDDPVAATSTYMKEEHALHQLFSTFGTISAIEVVPSTTSSDDTDAASAKSTSLFDLYVQFKTYEGVRKVLSALTDGGSRVLCHTSHVKLFVPLVAQVDTTEYLSDAKIRQRRFARDQRIHEHQAKAAAASAAEKARQVSVEQATALLGLLGDDLDEVADDAIKLSVGLTEVKAAAAAYAALKAAPSMEQVATVRLALDTVRKQVEKAVQDKAEKDAAAQRATWAKQVDKAATVARELKLARLHKQLTQAKDSFSDYISHVAVVADVAAADEALAVAMASATKTPSTKDGGTSTLNKAEDVQAYLKKLDEDVDEAVHSVEAVVRRLEAVGRFYAQSAAIAKWPTPSKCALDVQSLLQAVEDEAWGESTEDLTQRLDHLDKMMQATETLHNLERRVGEIAARLPSTSANPRDEDDDDDSRTRALHLLHDTLRDALHSVASPDELPEIEAQIHQLDADVEEFRQEKAQRLKDAASLPAQMHRIRAARMRLAAWREDQKVTTKEYAVQRVTQHPDRHASESSKRPRLVKYVVASRGRLASTVWLKDPETGAIRAPKTEEERQLEDMEALRIQVVESQRRKEAEAAAQVAREAELRALVLQSMKASKRTKFATP